MKRNRKRPEHNWQYSQLCEHIKGIAHNYGAFFNSGDNNIIGTFKLLKTRLDFFV